MNATDADDRCVVSVLTAVSAGAIAVVQVAGPAALQIAETLFRPRSGKRFSEYRPGCLAYGDVRDGAGRLIDDGLALRGGSDRRQWVQIHLHGGVRIVQRLIQAAEQLGAVLASDRVDDAGCPAPAWPGAEDRSFDWLDPLSFWAQGCLRAAATEPVVRWLSAQPTLWAKQCERWRRLLGKGRIEAVAAEVQVLLAEAEDLGRTWRGRSIAIVGLPNVGKSTIANRLAGRASSLVTDRPGTTRDWVGRPAAVAGWPITLIDTAGWRDTADPVEAEGVTRALTQAAQADVRLIVLDASVAASELEERLFERIRLRPSDILAYNKCDLPVVRSGPRRQVAGRRLRAVKISALTGAGWADLQGAILQVCGFAALQRQNPVVFCAELQRRIEGLAQALRDRNSAEAIGIVETLAARRNAPQPVEARPSQI